MSGENGWGEYSKLVLKELETLAKVPVNDNVCVVTSALKTLEKLTGSDPESN